MIEEFQLKDIEFEFLSKIVVDCSGKRPVVDVHSQADLNIRGFEDFSTVPPTEILKKLGLITDASASHPTKKRRIVYFDSTTAEEQVYQKIPYFVSTKTVSTQKITSSGSERVHVEKTTPSSSIKSVCQDNSDEKLTQKSTFFNMQSYNVEGCSKDNATASLDALVDSMDVEGVSTDIGPATLESLFAAVGNLKPDNTNVETSIMQVDYSSTLFESAQIELDAILKVIAAPVDDIPIEVVPLSESVVNQHDISDSQLPSDFSDAVVAAHQATKFSSKKTRMRSKVFKYPYTTEYASGSKAIDDQIVEPKQKFAFDDFLISDNMSRGVIEEYKQWVEEGLLKFHAKK
ncbi:hypothetical protein CQW23_14912 [Capsicum baccatum]|uniref:Uncharacterized protein n=1 Tax=Capsicum baccatum TaxID=33114 RepID=A0A2G2WKI9_CAPBA|nr:hypothetical protein CQW23_14912 [Capsicum baccatum]